MSNMKQISELFRPGKPIVKSDMLVGRTWQLNRAKSVLESGGRTIVITGARGIGKTSLANIVSQSFGEQIETQCHSGTTFNSWALQLLSRCGENIKLVEKTIEESYGAKFAADLFASFGISGTKKTTQKEKGIITIDITPDILFELLTKFPSSNILVVDEFDRTPHKDTLTIELFGDFIKLLGNRSDEHNIKLIFIGVSSSAQRLFNGHPSIKRNVVAIHLKRLSQKAVKSYIQHITELTDYTFDPVVVELFQKDFKGFPHFVHLVGEYCLMELPSGGNISVYIYEKSVDLALDEMLGMDSRFNFIKNRNSFAGDLILEKILKTNSFREKLSTIYSISNQCDVQNSEIQESLNDLYMNNILVLRNSEIITLIDPEIAPFLQANLRKARYVSKKFKEYKSPSQNQLSLNI